MRRRCSALKEHAVCEKISMSQDGEEHHQDRLGGLEQGNVRVFDIRSRWVAKEHNIVPRPHLFQRNITSGASEASHLAGSVRQPGGDSALGDRRAKSVLLCDGKA